MTKLIEKLENEFGCFKFKQVNDVIEVSAMGESKSHRNKATMAQAQYIKNLANESDYVSRICKLDKMVASLLIDMLKTYDNVKFNVDIC